MHKYTQTQNRETPYMHEYIQPHQTPKQNEKHVECVMCKCQKLFIDELV